MTNGRGRHVSSGSSAFIRDLVIMAVGIVIVGMLLYGALSLFASLGGDGSNDGGTTTEPTATTVPSSVTTTTTPQTSSSTTTTAATSTTTTVAELRQPSELTVIVLNSTGRSGIAAALTQELAALGYQTLPATNYEGDALEQSRVWHTAGLDAEAEVLRDAEVPDALVEIYEGPDLGADIVVVLGASYQG